MLSALDTDERVPKVAPHFHSRIEMSSSIDTPPPFMEEEAEPQDTLDLRIAAIFIILLSSAMGGFAPFAIKVFRDASHPVTLILRAFSAGIILALALVHVSLGC